MRKAIKAVFLAVIWGAAICIGYAKEPSSFWQSITNPATLEQLKSFVAAKEAQADSAARADGKGMPPEYKTFFNAADKGDWLTVSNLFWEIGGQNGGLERIYTKKVDMTFRGIRWEALKEIWGAYAAFADGDEKYSELFGSEITQSILPGSIYFGGSDPGRFVITALQTSQIKGEPFFTLTQNALADGSYLDYLRSMYGKEIYIPTREDSDRCFNDFYKDLQTRFQNHQLKPGEDVTISNGQPQASGKIAVMEINALIAKVIFDKETNREFYVEEYIPLDWMYPYLEPHGLIFKLSREPLVKLSNETIERDHDYWGKMVSPMIGDWLNDDTSIKDVAAFVGKVSIRHDFNGFQGDPIFEENHYAHTMFAKERLSIADLYAWRAKHSNDETEKKRMEREADFAFRQAWALCPDFPEVVFRYVQFLMDFSRVDDAITVAKTCLLMDTRDDAVSSLLGNLEQCKKQSDDRANYLSRIAAMENEAKANPTDYTNIFSLATFYLQAQQTNRANLLLEQTISQPNAPPAVLRKVALYWAQTDQFSELETALKKVTVVMPNQPETWYDLARLEAVLKKYDEAVNYLRTAIRLSDKRLKTNPQALNIRKAARIETNFGPIRDQPDFQKLVAP